LFPYWANFECARDLTIGEKKKATDQRYDSWLSGDELDDVETKNHRLGHLWPE
jgi:hypothetical protein